MKITKTAFIIPGSFEYTDRIGYKEIAKAFRAKGFKVVPVDIKWSYNTVSGYLEQFKNIYQKYKSDYNVVLGFSFGAMIAYLTAIELKPDHLMLCSLSPYFAEDLLPEFEKYIGKKRAEDFKNHKFDEHLNVEGKITLFIGDKELPEVKARVLDASKKLKNSKLIEIKGATHNISGKKYFENIKKYLVGLSN